MVLNIIKFLFSFGLVIVTDQQLSADPQKNFDFYVLSLSWSPEFCNVKPEERQCGRGYGLVLHGLWPQYQSGYPEFCSKQKLSAKLLREYSGVYPSDNLAFHEWKKHGTCSGLSPRDYLQLSKQLKQNFIEPPALKMLQKPLRTTAAQLTNLIISANPNLDNHAVTFSCSGSGRFLKEIYVCLDKSGTQAAACSVELQRRSRRSCGQTDFLIRNVR